LKLDLGLTAVLVAVAYGVYLAQQALTGLSGSVLVGLGLFGVVATAAIVGTAWPLVMQRRAATGTA
jgi:hypothetical protein